MSDLHGVEAVALGFGAISAAETDPWLGQHPVEDAAVAPLRALHSAGLRLILASNTISRQTRWSSLRAAQVADLFYVALLSDPLGVAKPHPCVYRMVIAAADCDPCKVLFVGEDLAHDVIAPMEHGMRGCLVRRDGLGPFHHEFAGGGGGLGWVWCEWAGRGLCWWVEVVCRWGACCCERVRGRGLT